MIGSIAGSWSTFYVPFLGSSFSSFVGISFDDIKIFQLLTDTQELNVKSRHKLMNATLTITTQQR